MAAISDTLRVDLTDPEFAEVYAETFLDSYVSTQIKVLREQRKLTQAQLATKLGTTQTVISRIENVNYSAWNIGTLKKLARALGVRLSVSFETFGSLIDDMETLSRSALERATIDADPELQHGGDTVDVGTTMDSVDLVSTEPRPLSDLAEFRFKRKKMAKMQQLRRRTPVAPKPMSVRPQDSTGPEQQATA